MTFFHAHIEQMSVPEQKKIQEANLQKQLQYVFAKSTFYQEKFRQAGITPDDIKTLDDLKKLPFTTKEELRDSQLKASPFGEYLCADPKDLIRVHSSSGTTGRPTYIGITKHDCDVWRDIVARVYYAEGVRSQSTVVFAMGLSFFVGGLPSKDGIEYIGATFVPIGTGATDRVISSIQNLGADVLSCTPSYAIYLAEYLRNKLGIEPKELGLKIITTGGEPGGGLPETRSRIEKDWGCKVVEGMGNADMAPIIFGECEHQQGMHFLAPDYIICELIDPDNGDSVPLEDGNIGELVYTAIDRESVPLIRFRTRDRIQVFTTPCKCGRTGFRTRCIGRTDDMLILRGVNVFPSAIKDVVSTFRPETTGEIQVILQNPGPAVEPPLAIQVEYGPEVSIHDLPQLKQRLEHVLREKLIFTSLVELVPPYSLPRYEMKAKLLKVLN
jgi:phenylacetate-CoA ligase